MTSTRRPRFGYPVLLLRDALGRFVSLRKPKVVAAARRPPRREPILSFHTQLVLF